MKHVVLVAVGLLGLAAASASAADLGTPAPPPYKAPPPPVPVYSWSGCYLAGGGGYGMWNQDVFTVDSSGVVDTATTTAGGRGWFGTGQVGCDYQFAGDFVIGAFGDGDFANIHGNATVFENVLFGDEKESWSWSVGGRVGYLVFPQLLGFVSAGFTEAHFNAFELFDPTGPSEPFHISAHTYHGWFLGTGYEYALKWLPGFFWKTEYRYSEYQSATLPVLEDTTNSSMGESINSKKFQQVIRSELVWRFNWGAPAY
jgi:outer membrane immunogenic protein